MVPNERQTFILSSDKVNSVEIYGFVALKKVGVVFKTRKKHSITSKCQYEVQGFNGEIKIYCAYPFGHIRITSVNSTNQASDVCRRTTSGSDNNNPHSNVNINMTTSKNHLHVFDFKQYEVDKM